MGTLEERGDTAEKILVEAAPGDFELRLNLSRKEDVGRVEFRLTEKVVRIDVECRRHKDLLYRALPGTWSAGIAASASQVDR